MFPKKNTTSSTTTKTGTPPTFHFSPRHLGRPEKQRKKKAPDEEPPRPPRRRRRDGEQRGRTETLTPPPSPLARCRQETTHTPRTYTIHARLPLGAPPNLTAPEQRPEAEGSSRFTGETLSCAVASLSPPLYCSEGKRKENLLASSVIHGYSNYLFVRY